MSNLLAGIAPQAGLVAQSTGQTAAQLSKGVDNNTAQLQVVQRSVASGIASSPAAIVSLSADGKNRAASYGEGRSVDSTYEKQSKEEKLGGSKDGQGEKKKTVSVTA